MSMNEDQFMAALAIYREARNQSAAAKAAVFAVMRNRAADSKARWPRTLWSVVLQKRQFSSFNADDPNAAVFPRRENMLEWAAWRECVNVVQTPLLADPTEGANHYHDISIPPPFTAWLGKSAKLADLVKLQTVAIGAFRFYKL